MADTVAELIALLQKMDPESEPLIRHDGSIYNISVVEKGNFEEFGHASVTVLDVGW